MFGFLVIVLMAVMVWLLWNISRNTADTLEKQSALQYEIVALEKQLDEIVAHLRADAGVTPSVKTSAPAGSVGSKNPAVVTVVEDQPLG